MQHAHIHTHTHAHTHTHTTDWGSPPPPPPALSLFSYPVIRTDQLTHPLHIGRDERQVRVALLEGVEQFEQVRGGAHHHRFAQRLELVDRPCILRVERDQFLHQQKAHNVRRVAVTVDEHTAMPDGNDLKFKVSYGGVQCVCVSRCQVSA